MNQSAEIGPVLQKQHALAAHKIRELILRGTLAPGERLTEAGLADLLGLSRTPVRQALPTLALDGLLVPVGKRGYAVKVFTHDESLIALETRALLEGMAARIAAQKGLTQEISRAFQECLEEGDRIVNSPTIGEEEETAYGVMNQRFHGLILAAADKALLEELVGRCNAVPFVSPLLMAFSDPNSALIQEDLIYAHRQHHAIFEALSRQETLRVEMLLREHAANQRHSMAL
jgi:GntR family transcriptional regulator, vanillate catabolism transcriptional regulator